MVIWLHTHTHTITWYTYMIIYRYNQVPEVKIATLSQETLSAYV